MQSIHVIDNAVSPDTCAAAFDLIRATPESYFDTYDNPFESKQVLQGKHPSGVLGSLLSQLEHQVILARVLLGRDLVFDSGRQYASIFRYGSNSRLDVHVDAGIDPRSGLRKAATAILYLNDLPAESGGDLEFWRGTDCTVKVPTVFSRRQTVRPYSGRLVLFENHDSQWHGMTPMGPESSVRAAITVSYLTEELSTFANQRRRAYFVPRPGQQWTDEHYRLRDMRADKDRAAEVYRAGAGVGVR